MTEKRNTDKPSRNLSWGQFKKVYIILCIVSREISCILARFLSHIGGNGVLFFRDEDTTHLHDVPLQYIVCRDQIWNQNRQRFFVAFVEFLLGFIDAFLNFFLCKRSKQFGKNQTKPFVFSYRECLHSVCFLTGHFLIVTFVSHAYAISYSHFKG